MSLILKQRRLAFDNFQWQYYSFSKISGLGTGQLNCVMEEFCIAISDKIFVKVKYIFRFRFYPNCLCFQTEPLRHGCARRNLQRTLQEDLYLHPVHLRRSPRGKIVAITSISTPIFHVYNQNFHLI